MGFSHSFCPTRRALLHARHTVGAPTAVGSTYHFCSCWAAGPESQHRSPRRPPHPGHLACVPTSLPDCVGTAQQSFCLCAEPGGGGAAAAPPHRGWRGGGEWGESPSKVRPAPHRTKLLMGARGLTEPHYSQLCEGGHITSPL